MRCAAGGMARMALALSLLSPRGLYAEGCADSVPPSALQERWTKSREARVRRLLEAGDRDSLFAVAGCRASNGEPLIDLRGLRSTAVRIGPGNRALEGNDLSFATIDTLIVTGGHATRMFMKGSTFGVLSATASDLTN